MKVVETNIAIAANGRNTHASLQCQLACVELLSKIVRQKEIVALDVLGLILTEYSRHLDHKGYPAVGDEFFKYLNDNQYYEDRVTRVEVNQNQDPTTGFDELPINTMDPSDRKFLAVAINSGAVIFNALDSDWHENLESIKSMGIHVEQICPEHGCPI